MASDIVRSLPCNVEAEQYVLGSIIFDNECIPDVMTLLKVDEFYLEQHKIIYAAMLEISNRAEPIDFITIKSQLGSNFDNIGGIEYLSKIRLMVSTTSNLKYHVKIIKDKAVLITDSTKGNERINIKTFAENSTTVHNALLELSLQTEHNISDKTQIAALLIRTGIMSAYPSSLLVRSVISLIFSHFSKASIVLATTGLDNTIVVCLFAPNLVEAPAHKIIADVK